MKPLLLCLLVLVFFPSSSFAVRGNGDPVDPTIPGLTASGAGCNVGAAGAEA